MDRIGQRVYPRGGKKRAVTSGYALVLNAGSSSLKFCVYARPENADWRMESRGQIEGIGSSPRLSAKHGDGQCFIDRDLGASVRDGGDALETLAAWLRSNYAGARVLGVGHRIVHGGRCFAGPTLVTSEVIDEIRRLIPLAPLHQPHNLAAIEAVSQRLPDVPQVACFDTSFHQTQPEVAKVIPLPSDVCGSELQRYGFHGLSYEYVASALPRVAPEVAQGRVIVAHLGSGASLCALHGGKSVDCSFGFTALDGLCMGTRPGSLDPGAILYMFQSLGLSIKDVETILYKKSGLLGISGISNDMRDLLQSPSPEARLAVDYFVYRASKEIGALASVLGGLDGLVFTAGIGENSAEIRRRICQSCAWLGVKLDLQANAHNGPKISDPASGISVWVIPTDEELMIARHTGSLLGLVSAQ
jgi:acetate kinase